MKQAYQRIFARAGIHDGPHALRHTFATIYLRHGGNLANLQRILGHQNIRTTSIYIHMVTDDLVAEHHQLSPAREYAIAQQRMF